MWRRVGSILSLCAGVASTLGTRPSRAEPPPNLRVSLEYEADEGLGCPSAEEFRASVVRQLGYSVFAAPGAGQRLRIQIAPEGARARARIEWFDRERNSEGERQLTSEGPGCSDLTRSLTFAVAVQIQLHASALEPPEPEASEPIAPAARPEPEPAPRAKRGDVTAKPRGAPSPPRPSPPRTSEATWLFGGGVMARSGFSPGIGLGARAFGSIATESALLELSAHATAPSALRRDDGSGFTAYELGTSLAPCLRLAPLGLCAVATASLLQVRGEGVDRARSPSSLMAAAGGRVQLLWPQLGQLGVFVAGEVVAILTPRDVLLNRSDVWSTAPAAVTVSLNFAGIFE